MLASAQILKTVHPLSIPKSLPALLSVPAEHPAWGDTGDIYLPCLRGKLDRLGQLRMYPLKALGRKCYFWREPRLAALRGFTFLAVASVCTSDLACVAKLHVPFLHLIVGFG